MLPAHLKQSRVLTYGYNADVLSVLGKASDDRILEHAHTLVAELVADRQVRSISDQEILGGSLTLTTRCTVGQSCSEAPHLYLPFAWRDHRQKSKLGRHFPCLTRILMAICCSGDSPLT